MAWAISSPIWNTSGQVSTHNPQAVQLSSTRAFIGCSPSRLREFQMGSIHWYDYIKIASSGKTFCGFFRAGGYTGTVS
jgi:hypothetical protein